MFRVADEETETRPLRLQERPERLGRVITLLSRLETPETAN